MNLFNKRKKNTFCNNCGKWGHGYRNCHEPITSIGVINIWFDNSGATEIIKKEIEYIKNKFIDEGNTENGNKKIFGKGLPFEDLRDIKIFCKYKDRIKFLMIRRKHTLGYLEFMRGRYRTDNCDAIISLFQQMTKEEIKKIGEEEFDTLWGELWKNNAYNHENEKASSKSKFDKLKNGNEMLELDYYVKNVTPLWKTPEWGFPKGRRNNMESNFDAGVREFEEETGIESNSYTMLEDYFPLEEEFDGTNGIRYKHIYYLAINNNNENLKIEEKNIHQFGEIGDIGWFNLNEAYDIIRPYHVPRKNLLTKLFLFMSNNTVKHIKEKNHSSNIT